MSEIDNEKYIAIKKTDWIIILVLILLPLLIKAIYAFVPQKDVYFQIKYYANNKEIIENVEPEKTKTIIIPGKMGNMIFCAHGVKELSPGAADLIKVELYYVEVPCGLGLRYLFLYNDLRNVLEGLVIFLDDFSSSC